MTWTEGILILLIYIVCQIWIILDQEHRKTGRSRTRANSGHSFVTSKRGHRKPR